MSDEAVLQWVAMNYDLRGFPLIADRLREIAKRV